MKHFYQVNLLSEGRHWLQIVRAESEAEARAMITDGAEIISVVDKGPVEL